ncbi:DEAD/DEAH box helicase [uncultured Microbacterium sp.]|uniref:DEAD/DEAH box helicase n=1 Tax=uncultured Microbacterium sp. TaxID=191216 RepID=UPI0026279948|nr:DEAD/DEAH box helicase [uncultured Microbacterium sp.]
MVAPLISDSALARLADRGTIERGRSVFSGGKVIQREWDAETRVMTAGVNGAHGELYRAWAHVDGDGDALIGTSCSCPAQFACEHIVAMVLHSNDHRQRGRRPEPVDAPSRPSTNWRTLMDASVGDAVPVPLALGLEIRHRDSIRERPWGPRPVRSATTRDVAVARGELLLGMRPLIRSESTGKWVQGDIGWDSVRRSPQRFGAGIARWFTDLLSISRDSLLSGTAGDWLLLDHVESPLLWPHLRHGESRGIPVVTAQKGFSFSLADSASFAAEVARADDGSLTLRPEVMVDDRSFTPAQARPIGHTGVYTLLPVGARVEVRLAELPLASSAHALLTAGEDVAVPAADEAEFLSGLYPQLARRVEVRALGALTLPALPVPVPTLCVTHHPGDTVRYRFEWTYRGHGRFPFAATTAPIRDAIAEEHALSDLQQSWQRIVGAPFAVSGAYHDVAAAEFVTHLVPRLEEHGVAVVVSGRVKSYRELSGEPEITVSTLETTDRDWFDLGVIVTIDGKKIPFTPLFTALAQRRTKLLLVDGSYFSLAHPALDALRELIDEAADLAEWETGARINRSQVALWEDFEDLADTALPATSWRRTAEALRQSSGVPATPVPPGIRAELRPYQQTGFEWLAFLWRHRLGGILADDMGLGKTLQLLTLILHARESGETRPFLVVAPTSVLSMWQQEAARFAPSLRVRVLDTTALTRGQSVADAAESANVIVTSYTLVRLDEQECTAVEWAGLILDEAQFVKNAQSQQHRAVASLRADAVFAVTGTPLENSLGDLWALLKLTAPGLFPSARRFRQEYIQPIEQGKVAENAEGSTFRRHRLERLRRRIRPLVLRRTKELVAADLPVKQEQVVLVELAPAHRAIYDTVLQRERQKVLGLLKDLDKNRFIVFRSLTMLRMLALAPGLIEPDDATIASRKLETLVERVHELHQERHRALVFSQFTSFLQMAARRLETAGIPYLYLDGSTRDRREVIEEFRSGEQPVFLISLKAGGFGLTLTEADYVFMLDPWWNPAAEAQAIDRTHRIGQDKPVFVYRMIAADTIEEKVLALQQRKARLFSAVIDDDELFAQTLTADDIRGLL